MRDDHNYLLPWIPDMRLLRRSGFLTITWPQAFLLAGLLLLLAILVLP